MESIAVPKQKVNSTIKMIDSASSKKQKIFSNPLNQDVENRLPVSKPKYRRNSISEIKYESLTKIDFLLTNTSNIKDRKSVEKTNSLGIKLKSIDKSNTKIDFTSKIAKSNNTTKVLPANEHPYLQSNSVLAIKKVNGGGGKSINTSASSNSSNLNMKNKIGNLLNKK